jgi:hypothetical protein
MWNVSPAELAQMDARQLLHETTLLDAFDEGVRDKANG